MKRCTKCQEWKTYDEMSKDRRRPDGLGAICRSCKSKSSAEWQKANPDKRRETGRRWRESNLELARSIARKWAANHRDQVSEIGRSWRKKNPDRANERSRKWKKSHPDKVHEAWQSWYQSNAEKVKEYGRRRRLANPEKLQEYAHNRRSREKNCGGVITAKEWRALKEKYNHTCLCCGQREPEIKLTLDHVIPLFKGGPNKIENSQPLCKPCNSSKGTRIIDYRPTN